MHSAIIKIVTIFVLFLTIVKAKSGFKYRVANGEGDFNDEYPYVVSIQSEKTLLPGHEYYRMCTGTLIAPDWVLTAAHCFKPEVKFVRYGNMSVPRNASSSMSVALKMIPHPNYILKDIEKFTQVKHDIGLILITTVQLPSMGKLSSIDYLAMSGLRVRYAGFGNMGFTGDRVYDTEFQMLQLGQAMVTKCIHTRLIAGPALCIRPTCAERDQKYMGGDSGGPVFYSGKIVAVISGKNNIIPKAKHYDQDFTTPVSPYLDWIRDTMLGQHNIATRGYKMR